MSRRTGWWSGQTGRWGLVAGGVVCLGLGCAQLDPRVVNAVWPNRQGATDAESGSHRSRFQIDRDPESLNWLLSREVHNGMSVAVVNEVLGESGEEVEHVTNGAPTPTAAAWFSSSATANWSISTRKNFGKG
jgi:hypothetical protein